MTALNYNQTLKEYMKLPLFKNYDFSSLGKLYNYTNKDYLNVSNIYVGCKQKTDIIWTKLN